MLPALPRSVNRITNGREFKAFRYIPQGVYSTFGKSQKGDNY